MNRRVVTICTALLAIGVAGAAFAAEFPDGTIVVSDNWCAPNNDGNCFACNSGRLINRALCNNSYCDNMVYGCANPPVLAGQQTSLSGSVFIANETVAAKNFGWTSDEQGEFSTNAVCPVGFAMVGMFSNGSFSDNVRVRCQMLSRPSGWGGVTLTVTKNSFPISDEAPFHTWFMAPFFWTSGASCTNSFCDNMFYWFTNVN